MAETLKTIPPQPGNGPPKRTFRNYLLDPAFQFKYTGMVLAVTFVVATTLGYLAYDQSRQQTEMMQLDSVDTGETGAFIREAANEYDRNLLLSIFGGIVVLLLALGVTGILVTHRVVGPAYKLKRLFQDVSAGHLRVYGKLRQGDELWDVFVEFEKMINKLRRHQRDEITQLQSIIDQATEAGTPEAVIADLVALRDRMEAELTEGREDTLAHRR